MKFNCYLFFFLWNFATGASAWNDFGHMAVAAIAYPQLSASTKIRVDNLLQRNPDYVEWIRGVNTAERGHIAFIKAATWADAIKHNPDYRDEPDFAATPDSTANVQTDFNYRDKLQHRAWHYINTPFTTDGTPLRPATTPNIKTQIAALRTALHSPQSDIDARSYSLVWLLHLVGDAHQPLHATARFTRAFPYGDKGGNAITLCEQTCYSNLHAFWDNALGSSSNVEDVLRAVTQFPRASRRQADIIDENIWLQESAQIAQRVAYAPPLDSDAQNITLSTAYKTAAHEIALQRAAVAGARLANLLNTLLAD